MPSKKSTPVTDTKLSTLAAEHPEFATEMPPEPPQQESTETQATEREARIREAAYAAYERRGGTDNDAVQDWLDAEAQWERDQSR